MKRIILALVLILVTSTAHAAPKIESVVMDAALAKLATGTMARYVSGASAPADLAAAVTATLASKVLTAATPPLVTGVLNGSYTANTGDTSGRKLSLAAQTDMTPAADGTVTHVCVDDGTVLLGCTTITSQAVTTIQSWNAAAVDLWEIRASQ